MDRNCEMCKNKLPYGCNKWECQFEPKDSKSEVIEELEKIKAEIDALYGVYFSCFKERLVHKTDVMRILDQHIKENKQ